MLTVLTQNATILGIIVFISMVLGMVKAWGYRSGSSNERKRGAERAEKFEGILADAKETLELSKSNVDRARALRDRILRRRMD